MRNVYALLGISACVVFGGVYLLLSDTAHAPVPSEVVLVDISENNMSLVLTSAAFEHDGFIPSKYTCDGDNQNPPLSVKNIPEGTESLVLVMDDPDIPIEIKEKMGIEKFNHWAMYNLSPEITEIATAKTESLGPFGNNTRGNAAYTGPCPPAEYEPAEHRYIFRLYALSGTLNFVQTPTLDEVEIAAKGMMIEKTELVGRYSRVTE